MNNFTELMERKILLLAMKIEGNDYLSAIKDGFIRIMPFLIIGSFFLLIANLPIPGYNEFIIRCFGEKFIGRLNNGVVSDVIPVSALGAQGLFLSLIVTIIAVRLYRLFNNPRLTIQMPSSVPPAVANSFMQAMKQGLPPVNIITQQFRDVFLICGGTGFTLAMLLVMLFRAKSKRMREIAKLASPAAIFNINEPIIFGVPIALNPVLFISFIIVPVVLCVITYSAMSFGLLPLTSGLEKPWTTPIFISGFLICGWKGMVFQAINLAIPLS